MCLKPGTSIDTIWRLTRIQDALGQDGSELGHDVVVLVVDHLGVQLSELVHLQREMVSIKSSSAMCFNMVGTTHIHFRLNWLLGH